MSHTLSPARTRAGANRRRYAVALLAATTLLGACAQGVGPDARSGVDLPSYAVAATARQSLVAAALSPARNQGGFPAWYSDVNGVALEPCLDPFDPHCVLLGNPGIYDITKPQVFPSNYPDEFFYFVADIVPMAVGQCGNTGTLAVRMALEGAFINGLPVAGDQMTFGRLRLLGSGFCPLHDYVINHPYGSIAITTDDRGRVRPKNPQATADIGCIPAPGAPCDFSLALPAPVLSQGFLRWDPAVPPFADPGFLSRDALTPHAVVGGVNGFNRVTVTEVDGTVLYSTDLFTIAGRVANVLKSSSDIVDVGKVLPGVTETRSLTITNSSAAAVTIAAPAITQSVGAWAVTESCTAAPLAAGASCAVQVSLTGDVTPGAASGLLSVTSSASSSALQISLTGSSVALGSAPAVEVITTDKLPTASYGRVILNRSQPKLVLVRNEGPGVFTFNSLAVADKVAGSGDAAAFTFASSCPVGGTLLSGQSCQVTLSFRPTAHKAYDALISAAGSFAGVPAASFALDALGRGGIAMSSALTDGLGSDGFPLWYQDDGDPANPAAPATRVVPCLDVNDTNCVILGDAFFNPALPVVFPTNYPGEAFYYLLDGAPLTLAECGAPGTLKYRMAMEQSFATGRPIAGDQMTFARERITVTGGLCPSSTYSLVHPYGVTTLFVDAAGAIKAKNGTADVGCIPAPGAACDFDLSVVTALSDRYVRWDATAPAAPAGYLGDPLTLHTVTGSPFGTNFLSLTNATTGALLASSNLFGVAGKLAAPGLAASALTLNFGTVAATGAGSTSQRSVTITNPGTAPNTITATTVTGTGFSIVTNGCAAATLQARQSCVITLQLTGTAGNGPRAGTLTVASTSPSVVVSLAGAVGSTAVAVASPLSLAFGSVNLNTTTAAKTTVVTNAGPNASTYAMRVTSPSPGRTTAVGPFSVTVPAGCGTAFFGTTTCTLSVTFRPTTAGSFTSTLAIVTDTGGTQNVTLTGTGVSLPTATLTPATATIAGGKGAKSTTFVFTNTGAVPVVMGTPTTAIGGTNPTFFTVTANTCPAAGASLLVAGSCKITVTYVRPAGLATTVRHTATLTVNSNAGAKVSTLTGTN